MLVYVVTYKQLGKAFSDWIQEASSVEQERRFIYHIFTTFMATQEAKLFHTVTGLISFPLDQWERQFECWVRQEINQKPASEPAIRLWSNRLKAHLESHWCLEQKLIVKECLEPQDFSDDMALKEAV